MWISRKTSQCPGLSERWFSIGSQRVLTGRPQVPLWEVLTNANWLLSCLTFITSTQGFLESAPKQTTWTQILFQALLWGKPKLRWPVPLAKATKSRHDKQWGKKKAGLPVASTQVLGAGCHVPPKFNLVLAPGWQLQLLEQNSTWQGSQVQWSTRYPLRIVVSGGWDPGLLGSVH